MKRIFWSFLAIAFPWLVLLIKDDPLGAFFAMVMQVTIIGWIPASLWAFRSLRPTEEQKKKPQTTGTDLNEK